MLFRSASNLDTTINIAACIQQLNHANFIKTQKYNGIVIDSYKIFYQGSSGNCDDRYIKLKLTSEYKIVISVGSFHISR